MKPLLITVGEPAGIGPDCILQLFAEQPESLAGCVIASPAAWLNNRAASLGLPTVAHEHPLLAEAPTCDATLHCWNPLHPDTCDEPVTAGEPSPDTAAAVIDCIRTAALACMDGGAAGMITGPIEKAVLKNTGFAFPGHTEYLAHLSGNPDFVMMLASDELRVALLTTHMALRDVADSLSVEETIHCLKVVYQDLRRRFGIAQPNIGLCALNPHAGEQGHFGDEEIRILTPAAEAAGRHGIQVTGPLPADTIFSPPMRSRFDAIVCCYHDQGLIPIKALSFGESVNVTLGLPFVRTSVDHGTALDRAGSGKVSYSSLNAAIAMARNMTAMAVKDQ
ncbi:MAG TPA: 4-hydroxythreonine-4-phosphate dehydrogenase PdxA [Mariprofundaceae bacterium]|nr:4-hydroxythreonine-4-phosphate dehydrogenase PdxA [Mariprofundaceae bacterium]